MINMPTELTHRELMINELNKRNILGCTYGYNIMVNSVIKGMEALKINFNPDGSFLLDD